MKKTNRLKLYLLKLTNISSHVDIQAAVHNIKNNIYFRGPNVWILVFSIIIASVGLNVNSIPVIIGALLIFLIGRFLIGILNKMLARILERRHVDAGIQSFTKSLVNILLTVLLIVAIVNKLGVETTSFAALLASAGVAVGMALSGNLQNFAGGLIVLLFRPYKVGDWIESQGESGTVREIQIFHTILTTADNKVVYIPNGALSSGTIVNYSREDTRRVEWIIGVEYGENFDKIEDVTRRIIAADNRILDTPTPFIALHTGVSTLTSTKPSTPSIIKKASGSPSRNLPCIRPKIEFLQCLSARGIDVKFASNALLRLRHYFRDVYRMSLK